jgi:ribulose-phosphate 3-epimerase
MLDERGLSQVELEVDGGIKAGNIAQVAAAGASILVVGSAVYNQTASVKENVAALRKALGED